MTRVKIMLTERIIIQLELNNMHYSQLAERAGIPLETMRNIYYGKVKDPKASTLLAIARVFQVSVNYLMGEDFISPDEKDLLQNYRDCGRHGKSVIRLVGRYEKDIAIMERKAAKGDRHQIPCMKPNGHVADCFKYDASETGQIETIEPEAFLAFEITNNNYLPIYCKGDKILLEDRTPEHGERAMFMIDGKVYLRQFVETATKYVLKSFNKHGQNIEIRRMNEVHCIGTVIGVKYD